MVSRPMLKSTSLTLLHLLTHSLTHPLTHSITYAISLSPDVKRRSSTSLSLCSALMLTAKVRQLASCAFASQHSCAVLLCLPLLLPAGNPAANAGLAARRGAGGPATHGSLQA